LSPSITFDAAKRSGMSAADGALSQLRAATDPAAKGGEFYGPRFVNSGPPVRKPERRGFGSRIVELALPNELGGAVAVDYRSEGLRCSIRSPLSSLDKIDAFMPLG
jgi:hypothetical protein